MWIQTVQVDPTYSLVQLTAADLVLIRNILYRFMQIPAGEEIAEERNFAMLLSKCVDETLQR